MDVNLIFEYKGQGFGSKTTFMNNKESVQDMNNITVSVNSLSKKDITHSHTIGPLSLFHLIKNRPMIYSYHILPKETEFLNIPTSVVSKFVDMFVKRSSVIVATSPFCKKIINDNIKNQKNKPIAVISPGISNNITKNKQKQQRFRERYGIKDELVFYCVAPPIEKKGLSYFLEAASHFSREKQDVKFVWIGRLFPHLKANYTLDQLRAKHKEVIFTGFVGDISEAHAAGDILLFPSYYEGMGIPVVEAGSCGNPAVIRNIDSFSWLSNRKNCMKFSNKEEMLKIISELIQKKHLRNKLSKSALSMANDHKLSSIGKLYTKLYELCYERNYEEINKLTTY